jgi:hypothetical protein
LGYNVTYGSNRNKGLAWLDTRPIKVARQAIVEP